MSKDTIFRGAAAALSCVMACAIAYTLACATINDEVTDADAGGAGTDGGGADGGAGGDAGSGYVPACVDKACGEKLPDGTLCTGACAAEFQECRVAVDGTSASCVACDKDGGGSGAACEDPTSCRCGFVCARAFADQTGPGQCLPDCTATGDCNDSTTFCGCAAADDKGTCVSGACFPVGSLRGSFEAKVLAACGDELKPEDIRTGSMTVNADGESATFDRFYGCLDTSGATPTLIWFAFQDCGDHPCADVVVMSIKAGEVKAGAVTFGTGGLRAEWKEYVYTDGVVTEIWERGLAFDGTVTFTQANAAAGGMIAGAVDLKLQKYDTEICGPGTSPCQ
jgi:hypothetical protein